MLVVFVGIIPLTPNVSRNANGLGRTDVNGDEPETARNARLTFARLTSGWLAGPRRLVRRRADGGHARCPVAMNQITLATPFVPSLGDSNWACPGFMER